MIVKTYDIKQAEDIYEQLLDTDFKFDNDLNDDYLSLRNELLDAWQNVKSHFTNIRKYEFDLKLATYIYDIFSKKFDEVTLASYDFWRYISIAVIPDLLYERWGDSNTHYYKKTVRIYPFTLFWYIKLSWQGTIEKTYDMLSSKNCNNDTILQCVERPGKMGVNLRYYNSLMFQYCNEAFDKKENNIDIFRNVLTLNTARMVNVIPEFFDGGIDGYVNELLIEAKENNYGQ